jgi:hypothetical protein
LIPSANAECHSGELHPSTSPLVVLTARLFEKTLETDFQALTRLGWLIRAERKTSLSKMDKAKERVMTALATATTKRFTALDGSPFLAVAPYGDEEIVCVLGHPDKAWCRIVERNGSLVAEEEAARGSGDYRRAGKRYGEIFRRQTARSLVRRDDLVLAYTGDDFAPARYQYQTCGRKHMVQLLDGDCFETEVFEPYHFARNDRVWAKVDAHQWELAFYGRREGDGFRVTVLGADKSMIVPLIKHRSEPRLTLYQNHI